MDVSAELIVAGHDEPGGDGYAFDGLPLGKLSQNVARAARADRIGDVVRVIKPAGWKVIA